MGAIRALGDGIAGTPPYDFCAVHRTSRIGRRMTIGPGSATPGRARAAAGAVLIWLRPIVAPIICAVFVPLAVTALKVLVLWWTSGVVLDFSDFLLSLMITSVPLAPSSLVVGTIASIVLVGSRVTSVSGWAWAGALVMAALAAIIVVTLALGWVRTTGPQDRVAVALFLVGLPLVGALTGALYRLVLGPVRAA